MNGLESRNNISTDNIDKISSDQIQAISSLSPLPVSVSDAIPSTCSPSQELFSSTARQQDAAVQQEGLLQHEFGQLFANYNFEGWQDFGLNPAQLRLDDFDTHGYNDIFQLMDVSYQMSEQMYDSGMNDLQRF